MGRFYPDPFVRIRGGPGQYQDRNAAKIDALAAEPAEKICLLEKMDRVPGLHPCVRGQR